MIIGIDHLTYSTNSFEETINSYINNGFKVEFCEKKIPNDPNKMNFLKHYNKFHNLALLKKKGNIPIEIIDHGFENQNDRCPFDFNKKEIIMFTNKLNEDIQFFVDNLGFIRKGEKKLNLDSFFPEWSFSLSLIEKKDLGEYTLDTQGYTCVALLVRGIERIYLNLKKLKNIEITKIFKLKINAKYLKIIMLKTPSGAFIELLEISKTIEQVKI